MSSSEKPISSCCQVTYRKTENLYMSIRYMIMSQVSFFLIIFGGHKSFSLGHCYPCFGLLVTPARGFKARVESFTCMLSCLCTIPQIPLWCHTCWHVKRLAWQPSLCDPPRTCRLIDKQWGRSSGKWCLNVVCYETHEWLNTIRKFRFPSLLP